MSYPWISACVKKFCKTDCFKTSIFRLTSYIHNIYIFTSLSLVFLKPFHFLAVFSTLSFSVCFYLFPSSPFALKQNYPRFCCLTAPSASFSTHREAQSLHSLPQIHLARASPLWRPGGKCWRLQHWPSLTISNMETLGTGTWQPGRAGGYQPPFLWSFLWLTQLLGTSASPGSTPTKGGSLTPVPHETADPILFNL